MYNFHDILNLSYQRAVSPDYHGFFKRFYQIFTDADPKIAEIFNETDMDRQIKVLMQSMTHVISFANTLKANEYMENIALLHGSSKLNIPNELYDVWLDSLVKTVSERDPEFNAQVETAWRVVMVPGIEYMKSFSD
jgi:hemoglobin-like flavoprotein